MTFKTLLLLLLYNIVTFIVLSVQHLINPESNPLTLDLHETFKCTDLILTFVFTQKLKGALGQPY